MKKFLRLSAAALVATSFTGCEDAESIQPSRINFEVEATNFSEADEKNTISLTFTRPASGPGTISLRLTSDKLDKFTFSPEPLDGLLTLKVAKGATTASFNIMPINNPVLDGHKQITFTLEEVSTMLTIGPIQERIAQWIDDESPAVITFADGTSTIDETVGTGKVVTLNFSHGAPGEGTIKLTLPENSGYGTTFITEPAFINNQLQFDIAAGVTSASFKVIPADDALFNASRVINFSLEASGVLTPGTIRTHQLTITDDELAGMAKGYSTNWTTWQVGKTFRYTEDGKIGAVDWAQNGLSGTDTYYYSTTGDLEKIVQSTGREILYIRENGKVVKSEEREQNVLKKFSVFGYDDAGNIGEVAVYYRQPDGSYPHSLHFVYLYYTDGNLYKKQAYQPVDDDLVFLSEDVYDSYLQNRNMFGLEIIPGQSIQPNLPSSYTHVAADMTLNYTLTYQFDTNGKVMSRTATQGNTRETTFYDYY